MLETKRLIFRPWQESDAESLYEYAKDPDVSLMGEKRTGHTSLLTREQWEKENKDGERSGT